jgi:hypothetical protein
MSTASTALDPDLVTPTVAHEITPIVIDMGKQRRKRIKALKRGRGKLMDEVCRVISETQMTLGTEANGKELLPVVVIYRQKRKRRRGGLALPLPLPFLGG